MPRIPRSIPEELGTIDVDLLRRAQDRTAVRHAKRDIERKIDDAGLNERQTTELKNIFDEVVAFTREIVRQQSPEQLAQIRESRQLSPEEVAKAEPSLQAFVERARAAGARTAELNEAPVLATVTPTSFTTHHVAPTAEDLVYSAVSATFRQELDARTPKKREGR